MDLEAKGQVPYASTDIKYLEWVTRAWKWELGFFWGSRKQNWERCSQVQDFLWEDRNCSYSDWFHSLGKIQKTSWACSNNEFLLLELCLCLKKRSSKATCGARLSSKCLGDEAGRSWVQGQPGLNIKALFQTTTKQTTEGQYSFITAFQARTL